jgi:hypothetical protein
MGSAAREAVRKSYGFESHTEAFVDALCDAAGSQPSNSGPPAVSESVAP